MNSWQADQFLKHEKPFEHVSESGLASFSGMKVAVSILFGHGTVLLIMLLFGYELSRYQSFLSVTCASFVGLFVISVTYVKNAFGKKASLIIYIAFILKVCVGVWHFLSFIDSYYFTSTGSYKYLWDYQWMHETMQFVSSYWRQYGLLSPLPESYFIGNKNPFLIAYNGILYFLSGDNHLNISPWNALHSLYVAILVGALALHAGATQMQARLALTLAAFQPFGFISNIMWRDSVGQLWLILGAYLLISTQGKKYLWIILLPVSCFLAWSLRQPYLLLILALAVYMTLSSVYQSKKKGLIIASLLALIMVGAVFLPAFLELAMGRFSGTHQLTVNFLLFPLRLVRALAGPFPWYQVFMGVDGVEYMPADFLQAVYNLSLIVLALPLGKRMWRESKIIDPSLLLCVLIFVSAAQAVGVHISYVSTGMVLLLPLACKADYKKLLPTFFVCFYSFFIANLCYWALGLSGSGILMNVTGY